MLDGLLQAAFRREARRTLRLGASEGIAAAPAEPVFAYLHVPFCEVLCPYCSFHRVRFEAGKAQRYFAALRREIRHYHERGYRFRGAYVGGGTPTVMPEELARTLTLLRELNPGITELSVETNPKDLRDDVLDLLEGAGVSRLSVGVQSFDDGLLAEMERRDTYGSRAAILAGLARAAGRFATLNVDMIWNLPHQTPAMLDADLDAVIGCAANQVSFYPLMTAPDAARRMARHMGISPHRRLRDGYRHILARLRPAFAPASGWCFSRGGRGTGQHGIDEYIVDAPDYLGLGSGAFGYLGGTLYASTFSLHAYLERIEGGLTGVTGERRLGLRERMRYDLLMRLFGLRLEKAWVRQRYGRRFERALAPELLLARLAGAVVEDAGGWSLTESGMYRWVQMMSAFFESVNVFREQMRHHIRDELGDPALAEELIPLAEIRHGAAGIRRAPWRAGGGGDSSYRSP